MMEEFNFDLLRNDLIDYFGTATYYNPVARADLIMVSTCSNTDLINIAINNNFDLTKYEGEINDEKIR